MESIIRWKIFKRKLIKGVIRVEGSDFGLLNIDQTLRDKISGDIRRGDMGRYFTGTWERRGDSYVRRTKLPQDAPLYDRLREMADREEPLYLVK
jgi:hypothetical protein